MIIKIDGQPVKGLSLNDAVNLMRGEKGSKIILSIVRGGVPQPFDIELARDTISVVSVRSTLLEEGYAHLRIAQFQSKTGADLNKVLSNLDNKHEIKGVILDLRNNPGGVLQAAVDVVDAFIEDGLIVYTQGRMKASLVRYEAGAETALKDTPVVVLINGGSASASEIVAGALQDHKRAIVMGTKSFGKGSVQTVLQLPENHGIKLTTARYYTPNGTSIQAQGITPDIVVERAKITRINPTASLSEANLRGHLSSGSTTEKQPSHKDNLQKNSAHRETAAAETILVKDNQLQEALTLLKGLHILGVNATVDAKSNNKHQEG